MPQCLACEAVVCFALLALPARVIITLVAQLTPSADAVTCFLIAPPIPRISLQQFLHHILVVLFVRFPIYKCFNIFPTKYSFAFVCGSSRTLDLFKIACLDCMCDHIA